MLVYGGSLSSVSSTPEVAEVVSLEELNYFNSSFEGQQGVFPHLATLVAFGVNAA